MKRYALDCAWAPFPSPQEAAGNGFEGFVRYFARKSASTVGKVWTPQQIAETHAAGLWILGVFEQEAQRPTFGRQTGAADCVFAEGQWAALGAPSGTCVAYAYDFDADPADVLSYAEGIRENATFGVMAYCSDGVAQEFFRRGLIDYFWQTESTGFRGRWPSPDAHMIQHVGFERPRMSGDYDENTVLKDFAWWGPRRDEEEDEMQTVGPDGYAVLPLKGKAGNILIAADFDAPLHVRVAVGKGDGGSPGPVDGVREFDLNRGRTKLAFTADDTWASVRNKGAQSIGVAVDYS